jgi:hypothetical protein
VKYARLRKTNITCFLSYEESRFKFLKDMKITGGLFRKKKGTGGREVKEDNGG